ncbi:MAG: hypothetical protein H0T77_08725 [Pyrinomonadaceae bacterium]|nr:hypothetical protein [Pyrinomonadaceae bacterium]
MSRQITSNFLTWVVTSTDAYTKSRPTSYYYVASIDSTVFAIYLPPKPEVSFDVNLSCPHPIDIEELISWQVVGN